MEDKFLQCSNCVRWGQPWKLHTRMVLCENRKDAAGELYTPTSEACRNFIPAQQEIPKDLQMLRLFVQGLTPTQASYLKFAASQAQAVMNTRDSEGEHLALGDEVTFAFEGTHYFGSVEGVDPQTGGLCVNCRSFSAGNAVVPARVLRRLPKRVIYERLVETLDPDHLTEIKQLLTDLIKPIAEIRSHKEISSPKQKELLELEERYSNLKAKLRYQSNLLASLEIMEKSV